MTTHRLLLLPGDGIGKEVMEEVKRAVAWFNAHGSVRFETEEDLVGGSAYDAHGKAISDATMAKALAADAVIFGAVGGSQWDKVPYDVRPEAGLLRLRQGPATLRQSPSGDRLSGARRRVVAETRVGRGPRYPDHP